jgi:hypothetical protein
MTNLSDLFPAGAGKQVSFTASGNVTSSGKPVVLNSDGTVSEVAASTASGSLPLGTQLTVESGASSMGRIKVTADPHNTDRWMVSYKNDSGTSGIRIKFVTRSGTTLSDGGVSNSGSEADIGDAYAHAMVFDPVTPNKVLMVFMPGANATSSYGTAAVVLTLSTSDKDAVVSFGTVNRFETANFDQANGVPDRVFALGTSGNYLTAWTNDPSGVKMRVLTVSGTTVTAPGSTTIPYSTAARGSEFGFKVNPYDATKALVFQINADKYLYITDVAISGSTITATSSGNVVDNSNTYERQGTIDLCYLTSTKFVMIASRESTSGDGQGRTQIGNLNSGSFTYGAQIAYGGSSYPDYAVQQAQVVNSTVTPDAWILVWSDTTDKKADGRIGSYSTDTITLGTNTEISSTQYNYFDVAKADDADGHFLVMGDNNSSTAWVKLGKTGGTSTNVTASNFLGISDAAISSAASGNITIKGGIAATGLSSLTPGSDYYVQDGGTITTVSSNVKAGKALSATAINLEYTS